MARKRKSQRKNPTRSKPHQYPRGIIEINQRGHGFVKTPEGEFFVPRSKVNDAMDGDFVEVSVMGKRTQKRSSNGRDGSRSGSRGPGWKSSESSRNGQRVEARVARVLERKSAELIGRYEVAEPFGVVIPDDPRQKHDIFTLRADNPDIADGAIVKVRILEYPTRKSSATGEIVEVLGEENDEALLVERVVAKYGLKAQFPEAALAEAAEAKLDVDAALLSGYRDIRERFVFTIDPSDAKDFDDALSVEEIEPGTFKLGVHIADVSAYVPWDSSIDLEARQRATSVYLADRVIPMLPPALSENLCSLRPGEDRLCMTVDLIVDANARLLNCEFYPAVMRSNVRLSYDEALAMLKGGANASDDDAKDAGYDVDALREKLATCSRLAKARRRHRTSLGGLDFDTREAKVALDADGFPLHIDVREKNDATELIEESMIFANEVVAQHLSANEVPCAFRVHDAPSADNLSALVPTLQEFKWFTSEEAAALKTGSPFAIQAILKACEGRTEQELVTMLLLRSMMRAVYSPENNGHYGLGISAYCHFTSPIRRYPDLIVHRMLKFALGVSDRGCRDQASSLRWLCEHSSEMERIAEGASLESQKVKMAEYMQQFVGETYLGVVSGVTSYGMYVRLDNCVEGLVPIKKLGSEYYVFDEERHTLRGAESKTIYRLGQQVKVRLVSVNVKLAHIDFNLA